MERGQDQLALTQVLRPVQHEDRMRADQGLEVSSGRGTTSLLQPQPRLHDARIARTVRKNGAGHTPQYLMAGQLVRQPGLGGCHDPIMIP